MSVLDVSGLGISFGGVRAVDNVGFSVRAGEVFSIIGPNGAGKTTLFNLVSGVYRSEGGTVRLNSEDVTGLPPHKLAAKGLSRTFQNLQIFHRMTALENVMVGRHLHEAPGVLRHLFGWPGMARENRAAREDAMTYLERVHLARFAHHLAGSLPYGAMKRLEIARALAMRPLVLLLDEPAAGCNATETDEIDRLLVDIARGGLAVVLVEHDMKLVMSISDRVLVLDQGRVLTEGLPGDVARDPRVISAYLGVGPEVAHTLGAPHA
jgi:branched-chain amino acid transport system ATP-binding protein